MAKIVFYCHEEKSMIETFEYYKQDIDALKSLNHKVLICTKYSEIPLKYDLMFVWWWTYALYPVLLSRFLNKPCIITGTYNFRFPEDFSGIDYFKRPIWQRILIKMATKLTSLNLFVSRLELTGCSQYFKLANARYYPHIIHDDYLKGSNSVQEKSLFNLAWSGKQNLVRKGIPELLDAVRILKDEGVEVKLNLAGMQGDGINFLMSMIEELNIENEVNYLGELSREDKITFLRSSEIYVQPSHYEGFGVAIAEAMGCGACVLVCDVGAVKEVVDECGYYVARGSSIELAKAIKELLSNDTFRSELQQKAYDRVSSFFSSDKKIDRLKLYLSEVGVK